MNARRSLAALAFGLLTVAACTVEVAPNRGRLGPDETSGFGVTCPAEIFTALTCIHEEQGESCPVASTCHCAGGTVLQKTSTCVCEPSSTGFAWACEDNCDAACAGNPGVTSSSSSGATSSGSGASSSGSSAPSTGSGGDPTATCVAAFTHLLASGCSGPQLTEMQVEEGCQQMEQVCGPEVNAYSACVVTAPVMCDANGDPVATGCDAETTAFAQCYSQSI